MKLLERIAFNFLLKRGYQVTFPLVYFSDSRNEYIGGASYWEGKKDIGQRMTTKSGKMRSNKTYNVEEKSI